MNSIWEKITHDLGKQKPGEKCSLKPNGKCPKCAAGKLDYDGSLNLRCPKCGFQVVGGFT